MRPIEEYEEAMRLVADGLNDCQIARQMGIPRPTIRDWRHRDKPPGRYVGRGRVCPRCHGRKLPPEPYVYLLGMYLGDGCLSEGPRQVFRLRIFVNDRQFGIMVECADAMLAVKGSEPIGYQAQVGCIEISSWWKHWPCLFPQHGPGPKHARPIVLTEWQEELIDLHPELLLKGLIHSDGCRVLNWVNGTPYPRYQFTNASPDIRDIFSAACDRYGVRWRRMNERNISVARFADVLKLDLVIGPKA